MATNLRDRLLASTNEEQVTLNTRHLIDKVLARYSGKHTTLRELVQNAADAQATKIHITLITHSTHSEDVPMAQSKAINTLQRYKMKALKVTNNGKTFTQQDWKRLKTIAEGNPDETKIGAFGVGFYSVFADCEEPLVTSGAKAIGFFWKDNALFTKLIDIPESEQSSDTTFMLEYRDRTTPIPSLKSLAQFLATSMTFVQLEEIVLQLDDEIVLTLHRKAAPPEALSLSKDLMYDTKDRLFSIRKIDREVVQIDAKLSKILAYKLPSQAASTEKSNGGFDMQTFKSFFAKVSSAIMVNQTEEDEKLLQAQVEADPLATVVSSIFLKINRAFVSANVDAQFASELERATKKPPPKSLHLAVLTELVPAISQIDTPMAVINAVDIFLGVLPDRRRGGKIFIGFPTQQSTGGAFHVSAPSIIPTVERESIDLNARFIRTWNAEMLRLAGIVLRAMYDNETTAMKIVREVGPNDPIANDFKHLISKLVEEAFWTAQKKFVILVLSNKGMQPTTIVRIPQDQLDFLYEIPTIIPTMLSTDFIQKLVQLGMIKRIDLADIVTSLEKKALTCTQLKAFLTWASTGVQKGEIQINMVSKLLSATIGTIDDVEPAQIIPLSSIKYYSTPTIIPLTMPLPPNTLPAQITKEMQPGTLDVFGWTQLDLSSWIQYLSAVDRKEHDLRTNTEFALSVLNIVSKRWDAQSTKSRQLLSAQLREIAFMPTTMGIKKPPETHFPTVKIFPDLPITQGCAHIKEGLLLALGVRKTVALELIFQKLMDSQEASTSWSPYDLITYLASVRADVPDSDITKLKGMAILKAEPIKNVNNSALYKASQLFKPKSELRALELPILQWHTDLANANQKAERSFLFLLGLQDHPQPSLLAAKMSDHTTNEVAIRYFLQNYYTFAYEKYDLRTDGRAFLPIEGSGKLSSAATCFANKSAVILQFDILRSDLWVHRDKLDEVTDPPIADCIERLLQRPPKNSETAGTTFAYLGGRMADLTQQLVNTKLCNAPIIPIRRLIDGRQTKVIDMISPSMCFVGSSERFGDLFDFVDYAEKAANNFLLRCGAKYEPDRFEIAQMLTNNGAHVLQTKDPVFLADLQKHKLFNRLKSSSFLLGYNVVSSNGQSHTEDPESHKSAVRTCSLASAAQIAVEDDYLSYTLFGPHLVWAPQDESLEKFYSLLGSPLLSTLVQKEIQFGRLIENQDITTPLRNLILERVKLFLYDQKPADLNYTMEWISENLAVVCTEHLSMIRTLRGITLNEDRTAALSNTGSSLKLYVSSTEMKDFFEAGQVLVEALMRRVRPHHAVIMEMLLSSSLSKLQARGYNVERILQDKAKQAKALQLIEEEKRRKHEIARLQGREEAAIQAEHQKSSLSIAEAQALPEKVISEEMLQAPQLGPSTPAPKASGILSKLKKRVMPVKSTLPYTTVKGLENNGNSEQNEITSMEDVSHNLKGAVDSCRQFNSTQMFSPPTTLPVKEEMTYCEHIPGNDLTYITIASNGVRFYVDRTLHVKRQDLGDEQEAMENFAMILAILADVYELSSSAIHMFLDEKGGLIAFNTNGSLFFNLRVYRQLHYAGTTEFRDVLIYWFVIMAHELAHNLVKPHGARHSYYSELFVVQYFGKLLQR